MNSRHNQRNIAEFKGEILNICGSVMDTYRLREVHGLKHSKALIYNLNISADTFPDLIADCTADSKDIPLPPKRFSCVYFSGFSGEDETVEKAINNALLWLKDDGILFYCGGNFNKAKAALQEKGLTTYEHVSSLLPEKKIIFIFKNNIPRSFASLCSNIPGLRQVIEDRFHNMSSFSEQRRISSYAIEAANKAAGDSSLTDAEIRGLSTDQNNYYAFKGMSPSIYELDSLIGITPSCCMSCSVWFKIISGITSAIGGALLLIVHATMAYSIVGGLLVIAGLGLFAHGRNQKNQYFSKEFNEDNNDRCCPAFC